MKMVVVVFRNRVNPDIETEYETRAAEILALAMKMPGFVSFKGFTADDGERLREKVLAAKGLLIATPE